MSAFDTPLTRPQLSGTQEIEFVTALHDGRLSDPTSARLPEDWRFDGRGLSDPTGWWNGLLYSRWQVLELADLRGVLSRVRRSGPDRRLALPSQDEWLPRLANRNRSLAITLAAVEARYLPQLRRMS